MCRSRMRSSVVSVWGNKMELLIKRIIAHFIDSVLVGIPSFVFNLIFSIFRVLLSILPFMGWLNQPFWRFQLTSTLFFVIYEIIALTVFKTTIGKSLMRLKVRTIDLPSSNFRLVLRSLFKALFTNMFFWVFSLISLLIILTQDSKSSLHDRLARTEVYNVD